MRRSGLAPQPVPMREKPEVLLVLDRHRDFLPHRSLPVPFGGQLKRHITACAKHFLLRSQPVMWVGDVGLPVAHRLLDLPQVEHHGAPQAAASALESVWLTQYLRRLGVKRMYLCGLALNHDWLWTARDALAQGFELVLITDLLVALDAQPGACPSAVTVADREGAEQITAAAIFTSSVGPRGLLDPHPPHALA